MESMNILQKTDIQELILEEINKQKSECLSGEYQPAYEAGALDMANVIKDIIRKHLSREKAPEIARCSRDNDGWISVEERLPEDGTYLCTLAGELCGIEEPFTGMCGIENGIWDEPDCVIAWRPLPEPYRPERSEK